LAFGWSKTTSFNYKNNNKFQHNQLLLLKNPFSLAKKGGKKNLEKRKENPNELGSFVI
jgi:hypothetical protein